MSLESFLSRELEIRFIDARMLVNEAKINLNMTGYLHSDQQDCVREEALRLFSLQDSSTQCELRQSNMSLIAAKASVGDFDHDDSASSWNNSSSSAVGGTGTSQRLIMDTSGHSATSTDGGKKSKRNKHHFIGSIFKTKKVPSTSQ